MWPNKVQAVVNIEHSLFNDRPRSLIQMATGSGKTLLAVTTLYRLIKFGGARRVLFLVDRANLGRQAKSEFDQFITPDTGRKFTELYNVQHLTSNQLDSVARVTICTIQRLYSMLRGEELNEDFDEISGFELAAADNRPRDVVYNPAIPIEAFDFIVTDECHRSIYNLWRQVLEYFDAFLIGLTATPSKQTIGFFNQMSGINAILYYLNDIFKSAGFDKVSSDLQAVAIGATNLLFTIIAMSVIDRLGRKKLLLTGAAGTAACLAGVAGSGGSAPADRHRRQRLSAQLLARHS